MLGKKIAQAIAEAKWELRWRPYLAILAFIAVLQLVEYLTHSALWTGGTFGLGLFLILTFYERKQLNKRVVENRVTWDVVVNDVVVGKITDADYAAIRLEVFATPSLYLAQVVNVLKVLFRSIGVCLRQLPSLAFWIVAALALLAPSTLVELCGEIQQMGPAEIAEATRRLVAIAVPFILGSLWVCGLSHLGFVDQFAEETAKGVRKRCGVAAEGTVRLKSFCTIEGGYHFREETVHMGAGAR